MHGRKLYRDCLKKVYTRKRAHDRTIGTKKNQVVAEIHRCLKESKGATDEVILKNNKLIESFVADLNKIRETARFRQDFPSFAKFVKFVKSLERDVVSGKLTEADLKAVLEN